MYRRHRPHGLGQQRYWRQGGVQILKLNALRVALGLVTLAAGTGAAGFAGSQLLGDGAPAGDTSLVRACVASGVATSAPLVVAAAGGAPCPDGWSELYLAAVDITTVQGPPGPQGAGGPHGPEGARRAQGLAGVAGRDGALGPTGATGPQGQA